MFEFDNRLVQAEFGENAASALSPRDKRSLLDKIVGSSAPGWADNLIRETNQLRQKLKEEGIILPEVLFIKAPELPANTFRITFGIAGEDFDVRRHSYLYAMEEKAREFYSADLSFENIRKELNTALSDLLMKDYHTAMSRLMKVYYLSSLTKDQTVQVISLLNMAGICLINNQLGEAFVASRQAQLLVEKNGFYDPYLKFYAHKAIANIAVSYNDFESGAACFEQAFRDINSVGDVKLIIDALYNEASIYMQAGAYKKCVGILNMIVSYISNSTPGDSDREFLITLYKMRDLIAVHTEEELRQNVDQLRKTYCDLSKSLPRKAVDAILTILTDFGPYCMSMSIGALLSSDKYYINQHTVYGNNTIVRKVCLQ